MRIAIVHFHLQTGGVTRVIEHACQALADAGHRVAVLTGEAPQRPHSLAAAIELVPALGYEERREPLGPSALQHALEQAAAAALAGPPDLWHVHNHCLGKNLALPGALSGLAAAGHHLLLQPHDYAEDGRPALYRRMLESIAAQDGARLAATLYPLAPQIHYAALNARDHAFLAAAGVPETNLHRLPNAVSFGRTRAAASPEPSGARRRWLYPTRAIRRKNLGELLFWAAVASPEDEFATTQAPQNPAEQPLYRHWVELAQALRLPVRFAIGAETDDFVALLRTSHALISTSIAEGFGLAFLEPWLIGRPLAGRDLPEITRDFAADGIELGALYQRLPVPLSWLDRDALRQRLDAALAGTASAYGRSREPHDTERSWAAAVDRDDRIDFGRLDEPAQEQVLRHLRSDTTAHTALAATSPPIANDQALVAHNREVVERDYLLSGYQRRLERIYQRLVATPAGALDGHADGDALIARFQAPERLFLLRT